MSKNITFGYDQTKRMLNVLRTYQNKHENKQSIREQNETNQNPEATKNTKNDITVINGVDVNITSTDDMDLNLSEEQKVEISKIIDNFKQQVSNLVEFEPGLTISTEQIRLDGKITDLDFNFTLVAGKDTGLYVTCGMTEINDELIETFTKFNSFYQSYVDAMNNIITDRKNN